MISYIKMNELRRLPRDALLKELHKNSKQIVYIATDSEINKILMRDEFVNMFISCQDKKNKPIYCKQQKLYITRAKLGELLEIMAADILNPFKEKWLFNIVFLDSVVSYFKFIRRANEHITVEA